MPIQAAICDGSRSRAPDARQTGMGSAEERQRLFAGAEGRVAQPGQWWLHAMAAIWLIFTLMLFVLESLVLHRRLHEAARRDAEGALRRIQRLHVLLAASLVTVAGAVAGSHGGNLFAW